MTLRFPIVLPEPGALVAHRPPDPFRDDDDDDDVRPIGDPDEDEDGDDEDDEDDDEGIDVK